MKREKKGHELKQNDEDEKDLESPITKLTQNADAQSLLAFLVTHATFVVIVQVINYYLNPSDLTNDFSYIQRQGHNFTAAVVLWTLLHVIVFGVIYPVGCKLYNSHLALALTGLTFIPLMMMLTLYFILHYELQYLVTFSLTVENFRLMMKSISFLVEQGSLKDPENTSLGKFTYFLFAPTLIYRHSYPRTSGPINWSRVVNLVSFFSVYCYCGLLFITRRGLLLFDGPFSISDLLSLKIECVFYGSYIYLGLAFGFLHCYLNAFAEILSFADRRFYADWWNARSGFQFWRTWNLVVHNWLNQYIYKSYIKLKGSRKGASFVVFGISGVFYECATGLALRVWYPIYAVIFGLFSLLQISRSLEISDGLFPLVIGFLSVSVPIGFMVMTYCLEYAANINCPPEPSETSFMRIIPRFVYCVQIE